MVSPIGLGTVKLGRSEGVKYPSPFKIPSDAEIVALLSYAEDLGINLLDTAPAYGNSETRLGSLLKPSDRKKWVIATKTGEEFENGESFYNFSPEHTQYSVERSLKRLNTDYLDIVLVHSDGNDLYNIQHFGILECLANLKQKGLIRSFGMSTKTVEGGKLAVEASDIVMVTYNPIHTEEYPVITHAKQHNKGILIKKALASGHLDKFFNENPIEHALNFIFKEPGVTSVIIGTLNPKHLNEVVTSIS
jgi:aryl-alcohol dehydrogenase-like predicted oxidoreductase